MCVGVITPNHCVIQASTVFDCLSSIIHLYHEGLYVIWDGGDGCTTVYVYLMPRNLSVYVHLKMVRTVKTKLLSDKKIGSHSLIGALVIH